MLIIDQYHGDNSMPPFADFTNIEQIDLDIHLSE